MATLKDIARLSGITISSVSDILNDRPGSRYSPATRDKVKKAAKELGYDRNRIVQGMIRGRTQLIGIIVPDLSNPFYNSFLNYTAPIFHEAGYNLLIKEAHPEPTADSEAKALQTLVEFRVDGILAGLIHGSDHAPKLNRLSSRGVAIAGIGLPEEDKGQKLLVDRVGILFDDGLRTACQHLVSSGRKHFAFLGNFPWDSRLGRRWEILHAELNNLGLKNQPSKNIPCEHSMEGARDAFRNFLEKTPKSDWPDTLFTLNDSLAIGSCRAAADMGCKIPEEMAIIGFDNTPLGAMQVPSLSTIGVDLRELSVTIAQQLLNRIADPSISYLARDFTTEFIPRETS